MSTPFHTVPQHIEDGQPIIAVGLVLASFGRHFVGG